MSSTQIQQLEARIVMLEQLVRTQLAGQAPEVAQVAPATKVKKVKTEGPKLNKDGSERKKRTPGGWDLFVKEERASVRVTLEKSGEKVKATEVAKELGRIWSELGEEGKTQWKVRAAAVLEPVSD